MNERGLFDTVLFDTVLFDTVLFDIDTQNDFLLPVGALPVPGAEKLIPTFERIYELARERQIPIISTADAHSDRDPEFATWPPHCVAGTLGQSKVSVTLLPGAITIPNCAREWGGGLRLDGAIMVPFDDAPQIIVEKQTVDMFQTVTLRDVLAARPAERYVVFGVVTEICVWHAVRGLREMGQAVDVVTDAIASLDSNMDGHGKGRAALDDMAALGARLITFADLAAAAA
jgi:nicotinamidase/pyrazinamidase